MPELENQEGADGSKKLNRGEKKCRKALMKLGMKQVTGITRVTLKKRDGLIFYINEPEVLKSATNENSYAVFGELKMDDPHSNFNPDVVKDLTKQGHDHEGHDHAHPHEDQKKDESVKTEEPADDGAPESEEGITPEHIDMVMQHTNCTRNKAIRALRSTNDDMVNAIMELTR